MAKQSIDIDDIFRVHDFSNERRFKLPLECGEQFGPGDVRVRVVVEQNRLLIEGSKTQTTEGVQVARQISYEHELPDGVDTENLKAGWDPNEVVLVVEAPINGQSES